VKDLFTVFSSPYSKTNGNITKINKTFPEQVRSHYLQVTHNFSSRVLKYTGQNYWDFGIRKLNNCFLYFNIFCHHHMSPINKMWCCFTILKTSFTDYTNKMYKWLIGLQVNMIITIRYMNKTNTTHSYWIRTHHKH